MVLEDQELQSVYFSIIVLLWMLPDYCSHVCNDGNILIPQFFGLHRIKTSSGQKFRFVVIGSMFCTELSIHRRLDLKGSSLGRATNKVDIDFFFKNAILKDLDLNHCFYLEPSRQEALLAQIESDSRFLEYQHIMDYSLLLGVHCHGPQHLRCFMSRKNVVRTNDDYKFSLKKSTLHCISLLIATPIERESKEKILVAFR